MRILAIGLDHEVLTSLRSAAQIVAGEAASVESEERIDPSADRLRAILETYDAVAIRLSLRPFTAVHLAEWAHRMNARASVILISRSELPREHIKLLFDFFLETNTFTDSQLIEVLNEIRAGRPRMPLFGDHLVSAIDTIVSRSWCFGHRTNPGKPSHLSEVTYATIHDYRRSAIDANQRAKLAETGKKPRAPEERRFDFAVSYAREDQEIAEELAAYLSSKGCEVFFDNSFRSELVGQELGKKLDEVFRKDARFSIWIVSRAYVESEYAALERRSAIARLVEEKGREYILPIRVDQTELPDLPSSIVYLSLLDSRVEVIADTLIQKLQARPASEM